MAAAAVVVVVGVGAGGMLRAAPRGGDAPPGRLGPRRRRDQPHRRGHIDVVRLHSPGGLRLRQRRRPRPRPRSVQSFQRRLRRPLLLRASAASAPASGAAASLPGRLHPSRRLRLVSRRPLRPPRRVTTRARLPMAVTGRFYNR